MAFRQYSALNLWLPLQKVELSYTYVHYMVEFAIALMAKLELINTHSFNSFKLRIGEFILDPCRYIPLILWARRVT